MADRPQHARQPMVDLRVRLVVIFPQIVQLEGSLTTTHGQSADREQVAVAADVVHAPQATSPKSAIAGKQKFQQNSLDKRLFFVLCMRTEV